MTNNQSGQILILVFIALGVVLFTVLFVIAGAQVYFQNASYSLDGEKALALAEAGIDKALGSLNSTGGTYNGENQTVFGPGEFSVSITNKNPTTKVIKSTAYVPNAASPKVTRNIQIEVSRGIGAAFNYGLQAGTGGINMGLNSKINGPVYSNGNIVMALNNEINGDVYVAGGSQPNPDQESVCIPPNCADFIFGKNVSGQDQLDIAQSFRPATTSPLNKIALNLKKIGSPPNINVYITSDQDGKPYFYNVKASSVLAASLVTGTYSFVEVTFPYPPQLSADETYWIVLDTQRDNSNYWSWSSDSAKGYTRGQAKWSPNWQRFSPIWNNINADLDFKTYVGGVPTYLDGYIAGRVRGSAHANTLRNLNIDQGAYYQASSNIQAGQYYPNSPDPGPVAMALSDANIAEWKQLAENAGVYPGNITNCPSYLAAGKYEGSLAPPDNCTILVDSPIWFTGGVSLNYRDKIKLKPEYGSSSGAFIVDGQITLYSNNSIEGSGSQGSYMILISEFDSQADPEGRAAITFTYKDNNGIVYSNRGLINIAWGNHLTSVTGWKLNLGFQTTLDYDEGLAGAFFSSGPSGAYALVKGTYQAR